jgi:alpha-L-fucosidase 2
MKIDLAASPEQRSLPVTALLEMQDKSKTRFNLALLEKLFDTSRYLFICSTGPDYGPRLSGLFHGRWNADWTGDYTCNANVNLAVSGGNIGDLPEGMEGWFRTLERTLPQWHQAAHNFFGCRGILGAFRIDGEQAVDGIDRNYAIPTGTGPWLIYPMVEHYQITGDRNFLEKRLLPVLKEMAMFYEDFLTRKDINGHVVFVPSSSPENQPMETGTQASINSVYDISGCTFVLKTLVEYCQKQGIEQGESGGVVRWKKLLSQMPPYLVNKDGALQEWAWPGIQDNYNHRHSSHMLTVWPYYQIQPDDPSTRDLIPAVRKALDLRAKPAMGHSLLIQWLSRARIKDAQGAQACLMLLMNRRFFFKSLATSHDGNHSIYNFDSILCFQGVIMEMAAFTEPGVLELLPAMAPELRKGEIRWMKGRNRCTIQSLRWDNAKGVIECEVISDIDQTLTLIHRKGIDTVTANAKLSPSPLGEFARRIELPCGKTVRIVVNSQTQEALL